MEDFTDGSAAFRFDFFININKGSSQPLVPATADTGLPGTHKPRRTMFFMLPPLNALPIMCQGCNQILDTVTAKFSTTASANTIAVTASPTTAAACTAQTSLRSVLAVNTLVVIISTDAKAPLTWNGFITARTMMSARYSSRLTKPPGMFTAA